MTERAQTVERLRDGVDYIIAKRPNKVRTGGRDEGGGGVMPVDDGKSANSLLSRESSWRS